MQHYFTSTEEVLIECLGNTQILAARFVTWVCTTSLELVAFVGNYSSSESLFANINVLFFQEMSSFLLLASKINLKTRHELLSGSQMSAQGIVSD